MTHPIHRNIWDIAFHGPDESHEKEHQMRVFFNSPDPMEKYLREQMYIAFRERLIKELGIRGGTNQGAVYGHLYLDREEK